MKNNFFSKPISDAIKGIALLFMFVHHFFTFPEWYVTGIAYPQLGVFARYFYAPLKLCIPLFAFLTGYFYSFSKEHDYRYSFRKISDILLSHGIVCVLMTGFAVILGRYVFTGKGFLLEFFGLGEDIMVFSWYIVFYCCSFLTLPIVHHFSGKSLIFDSFLFLMVPIAAIQGVTGILQDQFGVTNSLMFSILYNLRDWFPCIVTGYLFAQYNLFESCFGFLSSRIPGSKSKLLFCTFLCLGGFFGRLAIPRFQLGAIQAADAWRHLRFTMDLFYAPMFLYGAKELLEHCGVKRIISVMGTIGKQSLYMWFLHGMFFNVCKEVTQPIIYAPKNPVLVLIIALIACYVLALLMDSIVKPVTRLKNALLFPLFTKLKLQ